LRRFSEGSVILGLRVRDDVHSPRFHAIDRQASCGERDRAILADSTRPVGRS
jgi:hypothetical protein